MTQYELPKLPYAYDALEPYIDAKTMEIHHTKHHQAYLTNLMAAEGFDATLSIEEILLKKDLPAIQNNGGGFYNHSLFWEMLSPKGGGKPKNDLLKAIEKKWGTFEKFQEAFTKAGLTQFGSGWAWLVQDHESKEIDILQRPNQNHPDIGKKTPLLGIDVWEHAYYLKYQNRRGDYLSAIWNVINWDFAEHRFSQK